MQLDASGEEFVGLLPPPRSLGAGAAPSVTIGVPLATLAVMRGPMSFVADGVERSLSVYELRHLPAR